MFGLLNINKPAGWTSRDVVNRVQRIVRPVKTGHAGTLDPLATGVLIVPVGRATRLTEYIHTVSKTYVAKFELGKTSDTEDSEGDVKLHEVDHIPENRVVERVVAGFLGKQQQRPPVYSALRVNGKRAYQLARQGEQVELAPREIDIFQIAVRHYEYPELIVEVECSSGTYIRSLGRDIGELLNTGAVMTALERTAIGSWTVAEAVAPDFDTPQDVNNSLLNPVPLLGNYEQLVLNEQQQGELMHGRRISLQDSDAEEVLGISQDGELLTVLNRVEQSDFFKPVKNFFPS